MPRLTGAAEPKTRTKVQFVLSVPLDLMNAMYFTSLVPDIEGVEGWPVALRRQMAPDLLAELDTLYNYPAGDPGIMGTLGDLLFAHPEVWGSVDALVSYIRGMADGIGEPEGNPGIQGLIYLTTFRYLDEAERAPYATMPHRNAVEARLRGLDDRDADAIMAQYDRPAELRERMARLVERFWEKHYRAEMPRRLPLLERSVASHRADVSMDVVQLQRKLTGRAQACLEDRCAGGYEHLYFAPSLDMGPYNSCALIGAVHALFYPCEPEPGDGREADAETQRLARIYRALADEQRLRILRLLRQREMYAQEIVERTGLHQSVVSRHLAFMKAVELVNARKQNNMKFYSVNKEIKGQLETTLALFAPEPAARTGG